MNPPVEPEKVRALDTDNPPAEAEPPEPSPRAGGDASRASARRLDPGRIRGAALRRSLHYTTIAWVYGAVWMAAIMGGTATELAKYLGANDRIFALLTAGPLIGVLCQLPGTLLIARWRNRKSIFLWMGVPHRVIYILVGLLPWVLPAHVGGSALMMVLLLVISSAMGNLGGQAWVSWMSDLVPSRVRGKYFSARSRVGIAVMAGTCLVMGLLLDGASTEWFARLVRPLTGYDPQTRTGMTPLVFLISVVFVIAGIMGIMDILVFRKKVDEAPMTTPPPSEPLVQALIKSMVEPLRDGPFMRYVTYYSAWCFAFNFCAWMWWVFLLDFFASQPQTGQWWQGHKYLAAYLLMSITWHAGAFIGYPVWGVALDRFGRKPVMFISSMTHSLCWVAWACLGPAMLPWLFLVQFVSGLICSAQDLANFSMLLEYNRKGGAGYYGMAQVIFALVGFAAASLGGLMGDTLGPTFQWTVLEGTRWEHTFSRYAVLAGVAVCLKMLADVAILPIVQEDKSRRRRETARYVFQNLYGALYGNLSMLIMVPLRTIPRALEFEPIRVPLETIKGGIDELKEGLEDLRETLDVRKWGK